MPCYPIAAKLSYYQAMRSMWRLTLISFLAVTMLAQSLTLFGTKDNLQYIAVPYAAYCGSVPCVEPEKSGVLVHLSPTSNTSSVDAYKVMLRYRDLDGIEHSIWQFTDSVLPWSTVQFRVGKISALLGVAVQRLKLTADPPVLIP